jgi:hypothetical protein
MYTCHGTSAGLADPHQHDLVEEAYYCYGLKTRYVAPPPPPPAPVFKFGSKHNPDGPLSPAQYKYVGDLGGDQHHAKTLTYSGCSRYISELIAKKGQSKATVTPTPVVNNTPDPRLKMLEGLLPVVPEGYYAVAPNPDRANDFTFIRYSRPTKGRFNRTWKFQRVIGTPGGRPRIEEYAVRWPSGQWSYYGGSYIDRAERCITELMLIVADHQTAALNYAAHLGRCSRCNAVLTDERSRWYGIGPECEKHWPSHMANVEAQKGPWTP